MKQVAAQTLLEVLGQELLLAQARVLASKLCHTGISTDELHNQELVVIANLTPQAGG